MASRYRKFPFPPLLRSRWAFVLLACLLPLSGHAAHLEFVSEVDGTITDVTAQRTMFFAMENGWPTLKVHNRNSGTLQTIPPIEGDSRQRVADLPWRHLRLDVRHGHRGAGVDGRRASAV
ncbi:hypothetical protein [Lysobacter sp.]|uniref:hypothetical protein n=1 Tax=Lysobacter sp. TaxID=72226 RepID=UPI002D2FEDB0|nr:hypothetical protein [Lysobacter sp.]HZX76919.1 hypothetical protein [Lysobacter sp.]